MELKIFLTVTGLIFDIFGALLLAFGVLTKSSFYVATQNLKKDDLERIKIIKQSCNDFKNSLLGLMLLCTGFTLQILAQFTIIFNSDVFFIFAILSWFIFGFFIKIDQQYRIEAAIDYILQRSPYGVVKISKRLNGADLKEAAYDIPPYANGNLDKIIKYTEEIILTDFVYGDLRSSKNKLKRNWLFDEIVRRYEASELPQSAYSDFRTRDIQEKSLIYKALRSFIF